MISAIDQLMAAPHAIEPMALAKVLSIAERHGSIEAALAERERRASKLAERERVALEAVTSQPLEKIPNLMYARARGPVAILEINGPIYRYASMFDDISAMTSVQRLATEFQSIMSNPAYHTVVLLIDSPGGEVDGINQFAEMLFAARNKKRLVSYIDGDGCSAAYWLAAATSEIYLDATSRAGSIGIRMSMRNPQVARQGMYVIVDSEAPDKDPDPATMEGMAELRRQIEPLAQIFRSAVSRYRDMEESAIRELRGGVRVGQDALDAGLADGMIGFEDLLDDLMAGTASNQKGSTAMALTDEQFLAVLHTADDGQKGGILEALKIKAEFPAKMEAIGQELEKLAASNAQILEALTASGAANNETFAALQATIDQTNQRLAAMDERLKALEGEQTASNPAGGYRPSQEGPPPNTGQGYGQQMHATPNGIDQEFMNFYLGGNLSAK